MSGPSRHDVLIRDLEEAGRVSEENKMAPPSLIHSEDDRSCASSITTPDFRNGDLFVPTMYPSLQNIDEELEVNVDEPKPPSLEDDTKPLALEKKENEPQQAPLQIDASMLRREKNKLTNPSVHVNADEALQKEGEKVAGIQSNKLATGPASAAVGPTKTPQDDKSIGDSTGGLRKSNNPSPWPFHAFANRQTFPQTTNTSSEDASPQGPGAYRVALGADTHRLAPAAALTDPLESVMASAIGGERTGQSSVFVNSPPVATQPGEIMSSSRQSPVDYLPREISGLAEAQPVEAQGQEEKPQAIPFIKRKQGHTRVLLLALIGILVLVGVVVGGICGSGLCSDDHNVVYATTATAAPTTLYYREESEASDIKREITDSLGEDYFEYNEDVDVFLRQARQKALQWILYEDPMQVEAFVSGNILQRYILALFYLQTTKKSPWNECNPSLDQGSGLCYYPKESRFSGVWGSSWLSGVHECQWAGVSCVGESKITDLAIQSNNLTGPLPSEIIGLTNLETLKLSDNSLSGTIPTQLGLLAPLMKLMLDSNQLEGTIPTGLFAGPVGTNSSAQESTLRLHRNLLTGSLPTQIGKSRWTQMYLNNNGLSSTLPIELFDATHLVHLFLGWNPEITGTVPPDVSKLTNLKNLGLDNTGVSGQIPSELGLLSLMQELRMHDTNMDGVIPKELFQGLSSLKWIDISGCQFNGTISPSLSLLTALEVFYIADNNFSGSLPNDFDTLTQLRRIAIQGNTFTDASVPESLCGLRQYSAWNKWALTADCTPDAITGIPLMACPKTCCSTCCDPNMGICQDN